MKLNLLILLFLFFLQFGYSQNDCEAKINSDTILFTSDFFIQTEPLQLTMKFDIKKLTFEKSKEEYLPAKLIYFTHDSIRIEKNVRVRARGESRKRICHFPPFWLNIKKANINDDYILDKKIKIVTLCKKNNEYNKYLLKEYIIYKLYNIITDRSFRVRLLDVNYINTGRKNKENKSKAFMIEPEDMLSKRLNALSIRVDNLNYIHVDSLEADIMCFFQYMIGNTDFTVNGRHNIKLLKYTDFTKPLLVPIPYDFDFAGLVNSDYANPAEILNIENVTQRYFLGMCRSDYEYLKVMDVFKDKRDEMYHFIESFEYLDNRSKREILNYLDEFFKEISKPDFIEKKLRKTCR